MYISNPRCMCGEGDLVLNDRDHTETHPFLAKCGRQFYIKESKELMVNNLEYARLVWCRSEMGVAYPYKGTKKVKNNYV